MMYVGVWVCQDGKTKTHDRSDLKLGIEVLDTMSKPTDFGFKKIRVRVRVRASAPIYISRECTFLPVFSWFCYLLSQDSSECQSEK